MKYKILVTESGNNRLADMIDYCKYNFGHRGHENGWWWNPKGEKWSDGLFEFTFARGEDALAFKLARG